MLTLPLQNKAYVISSITFDAEYSDEGDAICSPKYMSILHNDDMVDIRNRLDLIYKYMLKKSDGSDSFAIEYIKQVSSGVASGALRMLSDKIISDEQYFDLLNYEVNIPNGAIDYGNKQISYDVVEDISANETKRRLVSHFRIERDKKIIKVKKENFIKVNGKLFCEACNDDLSIKYGDVAKNIIDVHHNKPLSTLIENTLTKLSDLVLLCPNCHRVAHRRKPPFTLEELKELMSGNLF